MWILKAWELSFQVAWWVSLGSRDLGPDSGLWYQGKAVLGQRLEEGKAWPSSTESPLLTASISWLLSASWGGNSRMFGFSFCRFLVATSQGKGGSGAGAVSVIGAAGDGTHPRPNCPEVSSLGAGLWAAATVGLSSCSAWVM